MPFISRIEVRAHSRGTEIIDRVKEAVLNIFPEDMRSFVTIATETVESHRNTEIVIVHAIVEKRRPSEQTFTRIVDSFSDRDRKALRKTLTRRLDDQCILFLRIDKQASYLGEIRLASNSDMISVRVHLRDYPKCVRSDAEAFLVYRLQ